MQKNYYGRIVKGIGGFYYVELDDLDIVVECIPAPYFRHQLYSDSIKLIVGDFVKVIKNETDDWIVEKIFRRKNELIRPAVSNVDLALLCIATKNPKPDLLILDKMLVNTLYHDIKPIICITKVDLLPEKAGEIKKIYEDIGFKVVFITDNDEEVVSQLELVDESLKPLTGFLAGPSGVGKSTLANRLTTAQMETGELSRKLRRGKHTTRHVELLKANDGGYLLDTPGFQTFEIEKDISPEDLKKYYPEFKDYKCRFANCNHFHEPDCGVKQAVREKKIDRERYKRYKIILEELMRRKKY